MNAPPLEALILTVRGQKVLLDSDLAAIYGVPTKALNQASSVAQRVFRRISVFSSPARRREWLCFQGHKL